MITSPKNTFTKILLLTVIAITLSLVLGMLYKPQTQIEAAEVENLITRDQLHFDEVLSDATPIPVKYPAKIYITQIVSPNTIVAADSETWVKHLYYYFVTRSGLTDIPFTYMIDRDGNVYEGLQRGAGASPFLENSEGAVLIGYLSNGSDYTDDAVGAMQELVESLSDEYGITRKEVVPVDMILNTKENSLSYISVTESTMKFAKNIEPYLNKFTYSSGADITFEASLSQEEYSFEATAGEPVNISLDITNSGQVPWYLDRFEIYLETADGKDSAYAVNGSWVSFQKVLLLEEEDGIVKSGETMRLEFQMQTPLVAGTHSEDFRLKVLKGNVVTGSTFTVTFKAAKGDFTLIKINSTPTGGLNVRKDPYISADLLTEVASGRIYVVHDTEAGWYKIEYSTGKYGWVYGQYITVIQK
jgi:hypothetical protein